MNSDAPKPLDPEILEMLHDAIGESLQKIILLYLEDTPLTIQKMHEALANNDLTTVGRLAHSLKSSSANLGAMQTSVLAAKLERSVADGEADLNSVAAAINAIQTCFDQIQPMFSEYTK